MKLDKLQQPISVSLVTNEKMRVHELFAKNRFREGAFIGVCVLQGCPHDDETKALLSALPQGERLALVHEKEGDTLSPLVVMHGEAMLGYLPFSDSVLPSMLISRGVSTFCYLEATDLRGLIPELAVSIYCEDY